MFAVEGCLLNGALVAASMRFRQKRTTENARTVFRITLAYLPLLLFFLLLHSERLTRDEEGRPAKSPTLGGCSACTSSTRRRSGGARPVTRTRRRFVRWT